MKRTNTVADALNTNIAQIDPGDGLPVIPIPLDGRMPGYPGPAGPGVPDGGAAGQYIEKTSSGSTQWATLSKAKVALSNVDNTSDVNKPISSATATALSVKADKIELNAKADLINGTVPLAQVPTDALVTDATVATTINGTQTGAAIDQRITTQVTPVVEQITADYIASDSTIVDAAAAAVNANPTIAGLEAAKWFRGDYPGGDLFAHVVQGMYFVEPGAAANIPNWPVELSGVGGTVEFNINEGVKFIEVRSYGVRPFSFTTRSNSVLNNTFTPWERTATKKDVDASQWFKGAFTGTSIFTWDTPGLYYVPEAKAATLTGWPSDMSGVGGFFEVRSDQGRKTLEVRGYGARPLTFRTSTNSVVNNTFHPWEQPASKSDIDAALTVAKPLGLNRDALKGAFTKRRGGKIGVAGKGVVALRFDDPINGLINSGVADALRDLQIPASAVHCSGNFTAPDLIALSNLGTWQTVADWAHNQGMEVWHHGGNHQDASGLTAQTREIITSLADLKAHLPTLEVNKWAQPGVGGTNYDGFALTDKPELFYDHAAGRLIAQGHSVSSGYMDGWSRPLDGTPRDGLGHWTVDTPASLTAAYSHVDEAAMLGTGLAIMLHPNNLDRAGSYSTSPDFISFLEYLAQLRDEGKIEILTLSGLLCADSTTSYRQNVVRDSTFTEGVFRFTGNSGWTASSGVVSTSGTSMLGQSHSVARHGWLMGGTMQIIAKVRATTGAVIKLHQSSNANPLAWTSEQVTALAASSEWQTVRLACCVPTNLASTDYVMTLIGRVSGGTVELDSFEYVPV